MAVNSCTCHALSFVDLKAIAEHNGYDLERLSERTGCGQGCGLCVPYLRVMLKTGITDLPILDADEYRRLMAEPAPQRQ